jgi:hypothetical protein
VPWSESFFKYFAQFHWPRVLHRRSKLNSLSRYRSARMRPLKFPELVLVPVQQHHETLKHSMLLRQARPLMTVSEEMSRKKLSRRSGLVVNKTFHESESDTRSVRLRSRNEM